MRHFNGFLFAGLLMAWGSLSSQAWANEGAVRLKSVAHFETEVLDKDGVKTLQRTPVQKAFPASEVTYTTTFENLIAKPVSHVVIHNPIPNDSEYQAGSAFGKDCDIAFSADGGKTFAAAQSLKLKTAQGKERPALAKDYTHIRWTYQGQLLAGKSGELGFRTVIK